MIISKWLLSLVVIVYFALACSTAAPASPALAQPGGGTAAFQVARPGLVSLPLAMLPAGDPANLHVRRRGQEIAVQVGGDALQFVAQAGDGPYTSAATYWVSAEAGPGLRAPLPALIAAPLAWERDALYQPIARSDRGDRWFAGELRAGAAPLTATLTLPYPLPVGTTIELHLTPLVRRDGHQVELSVAGELAGVAYWDDGADSGPRTQALTLDRALPAGTAELELALASAGAPEDALLLDRVVLPDVRAALPMLPTPQLTPVADHDLRAGPGPGQSGASFLIITHPAFRPALGPLVAAHQARGDRVAVVDVGAVYDSFSHGERDPEAIRALIRVALAAWHPAPRAVLLVGAGSVRMRAEQDDPTFVPPYLLDADPKYGEVACDTCYARVTPSVQAQPIPSIPVGRLPAHSLAEARLLVAKATTALMAPPAGSWRAHPELSILCLLLLPSHCCCLALYSA